jgi:hypothetical protein
MLCNNGLRQPTPVAFRGGRFVDDQDRIPINATRIEWTLARAFNQSIQRAQSPRFVVLRGNALDATDCAIERQHQVPDFPHVHGRMSLPSFSLELDARQFVNSASQLGRVVFDRSDYSCEHQRKI